MKSGAAQVAPSLAAMHRESTGMISLLFFSSSASGPSRVFSHQIITSVHQLMRLWHVNWWLKNNFHYVHSAIQGSVKENNSTEEMQGQVYTTFSWYLL